MAELVINETFTNETFLKQLTLKEFKVIIFFMSNINLFELSYNYPIKERNMQAICTMQYKKISFISFKVSAV